MLEVLVLMGGITTHPFSPSHIQNRYKNRIGDYGTIFNPYTMIMMGNNSFKTGILYGTDSVGGTILGSVSHVKLHENIGFVFGGYNYNESLYKERKLKSPSINGITPILGMDVSFKLYEGKTYTIESHNLLSVITTHSIGIKFKF